MKEKNPTESTKQTKRGYFISIEGGDGSGKTTQINKIAEYMKQYSHDVIVTKEPGGTELGEKLRDILLDPANKITPCTEMLIYAADRAQHLEEMIEPALLEGKTVITDRYVDSNIAYQGYGRELGYYTVAQANVIATQNREPDITVYLDIKPEEAIKRKKNQDNHELDRLEQEQISFHNRVYAGYEALIEMNKGRIVRIDANRTPEEVFEDIKQNLDRMMKAIANNTHKIKW